MLASLWSEAGEPSVSSFSFAHFRPEDLARRSLGRLGLCRVLASNKLRSCKVCCNPLAEGPCVSSLSEVVPQMLARRGTYSSLASTAWSASRAVILASLSNASSTVFRGLIFLLQLTLDVMVLPAIPAKACALHLNRMNRGTTPPTMLPIGQAALIWSGAPGSRGSGHHDSPLLRNPAPP